MIPTTESVITTIDTGIAIPSVDCKESLWVELAVVTVSEMAY